MTAKKNYLNLMMVSVLSSGLWSCSETLEAPSANLDNEYTKSFIGEFGVMDPNHTWSTATTARLEVKSSNAVDLKVFAEIDGERYLFADITGFQGSKPLPVTVPSSVNELIIQANGMEWKTGVNDVFDIDTPPAASRADDNDGHDFTLQIASSRTLKFNINENPDIKEIIENPYSSKYILRDSKGADVVNHAYNNEECLYPYADYQITTKDENDNQFDDMEVAPLYIRSKSQSRPAGTTVPDNQTYNIGYKANRYNSWIFYTESDADKIVNFPTTGYTYGIGTVGEDGTVVPTGEPATTGVTWQITASTLHCPEGKALGGPIYWIQKSEKPAARDVTTTHHHVNQNLWQSETWDTKVGGYPSAYCSAIFFDQVPVHLTDGSTMYGFIYGIFDKPDGNYQRRPANQLPDVYIIEFYDPDNKQTNADEEVRKEVAFTHKAWYPVGESTPYTYRYMAEDLGGTYDWDFNDLVVDKSSVLTNGGFVFHPRVDINGSQTSRNAFVDRNIDDMLPEVCEVTITPKAAGGIMPVYFAFQGDINTTYDKEIDGMWVSYLREHKDEYKHTPVAKGKFVIGEEMHTWLGADSYEEMLNTGESSKKYTGAPVSFTTTESSIEETSTSTRSRQYFIIVDKDNTLASEIDNKNYTTEEKGKVRLISSDIDYYKLIKLPDPNGNAAPQMMEVGADVAWPRERVNIGTAYPDFHFWVEDNSYGSKWKNSKVSSAVYE